MLEIDDKFSNEYLKIINESPDNVPTPEQVAWFKAHDFYGALDPNNNPKGYFGIFNDKLIAGQNATANVLIMWKTAAGWNCALHGSKGKRSTFVGNKQSIGTGATPQEAVKDFIQKQIELNELILQRVNEFYNKFDQYQTLLQNIKI